MVIPTYNGEKYISTTLKSVIQNYSSRMEIIIIDDCSSDNTLEIVKNFKIKNLRVISSNKHLGMQINFERILNYTKGEWITVLGQDDLMLPNSFCRMMNIISKLNNVNIIVSSRSYYFWNNAQRNKLTPKLSVIRNYNFSRIIKCRSRLIYTLLGLVDYNQGPQLYTGTIIKKKLVEKIYLKQRNKFFLYKIPDVSSAISILMNSNSYIKIFESLFLIGTSSSSTGIKVNKMLGKNKKLINKKFDDLNYDSEIPGSGIISSHHWYCVEAFQKIYNEINYTNLNFLKIYRFILSGSIVADKFSLSKDIKFENFIEILEIQNQIKNKFKIFLVGIIFKKIQISKKVLKNLYNIVLIFTNKAKIYYNVKDDRVLHKINKLYKVEKVNINKV